MAELEAEVASLQEAGGRANGKGSAKKSCRVPRPGVAIRCAQLKQMRLDYPVDLLCRVFHVSRSGLHTWLQRKPCASEIVGYGLERLVFALATGSL